VTHRVPQEWVKPGSPFTFVTEGVERAIALARQAAGDRNVAVSGTQIVQQALRAGLIDEIHIDLAHILLGGGIRLFGELEPVELQRIHVIEGQDVTHLGFRVMKPGA
jgi:dihydrofolate reductase